MRNLSKLLLVAVVFVFTLSCESVASSDIITPSDDVALSEITFTSSISSRATDTQFESGDVISITSYLDDVVQDSNVSYTFDGSIFGATTSSISKSDTISYSYVALYPEQSLTDGYLSFSVNKDQRSTDSYTQSDLMSSVVTSTYSTQPKLLFDHLMSKVVLNISSDAQLLEAVIYASATVEYDASTNSATTKSGSSSSITMMEASANSGYTGSYEAIVAPQSIQDMEITIYTEDGELSVTCDDAIEMQSGYIYTIDVDIKEDVIEIVEVGFSGDINDWINGGSLDYTIESMAICTLASLSADSYPTEQDNWIITDSSATTEEFAGLSAAIVALADSGREISLAFPYLESIPDYAIFGEASYNSSFASDALVSISAPVAISVGVNAMSYCKSMSSIDLPSVKVLADYALYCNSSLASISLPELTSIGANALGLNSALTSFEVPATVSYIGGAAFNGCDLLTDFKINSDSYLYIDGVVFSADKQSVVSALSAVVSDIFENESVLEVQDFAFRFCNGLTELSLPNATYVGYYSFGNCSNLEMVSLSTIESLEKCAFWGCSLLESIYLPSITNLNTASLGACFSLKVVELATKDGVKLSSISDAFVYDTTESIALTLGSSNAEYVSDNTLSVGDYTVEFGSIDLR